MKKAFSIYFLLIVFILFLSLYYIKIHESSIETGTTLSKSFGYSGAEVVSSEVYFWGKVDSNYGSLQNLEPVTNAIITRLGMLEDDSLTKKTFENDKLEKVDINGVTSDNRIVSITAQYDKLFGNSEDRFISVKVTEDLSSSRLEETKQALEIVFNEHKIPVKVNSCITGTFEGQLDYDTLNEISGRVLRETEAKRVEGVRDVNYISVSAYSPYIGEFINVNGKKVNLNLAIRYNSYENKTYIWLATPVITTEY